MLEVYSSAIFTIIGLLCSAFSSGATLLVTARQVHLMNKTLVGKTIRRQFSLVSILLTISFQVFATVVDRKPVEIAVNGALPHILGWDGKHFTGSFSSEMSCVIERFPYEVKIQMVPIARLEKLFTLGRSDLAMLMAPNESRERLGTFSEPIVSSAGVFVTKLDELPLMSEAMPHKIATMRGSVFVKLIKQHFEAEVVSVDSWDSALGMLERDRVLGVYSAQIILDREVDPKLILPFNSFYIEPMLGGAYISKSSPKHDRLLLEFNKAVLACRKD